MTTFKRHEGDLDGTRGAWRPTLKPSILDADGQPAAWTNLAVVSCPNCGYQFGVGGGRDPMAHITEISGEWRVTVFCTYCKFSDDVTLEGFGAEAFGPLKDKAAADILTAKRQDIRSEVVRSTIATFDAQIETKVDEELARRAAIR